MASNEDNQTGFLFPKGTKEVLSGTFAGVVGTVIGQPLDLVKVRLQTQSNYKGAIDCFVKVAKYEGIAKGLYRGMVPPLISLTFLNSLSFGAYSQFKTILAELHPMQPPPMINYQYFVAGGLTGAISGIFSNPFEMVKVRVQLDNVTEKKYRGSWHCATSLMKTYGVGTLYTGYAVNSVRETVFCTCYFGMYEHLKHYLNKAFDGSGNSSLAIMFAGGFSGMSAWFLSFPLDCIKANVQGQPLDYRLLNNPKLSPEERSKINPRKGFKTVVKEIWRTKGLSGFYSGVGPSLARAFVVSSTRFSAYEFAFHCLTKYVEGRPDL